MTAADPHRRALAEITVGEIPAENRRDVHQAGVRAVDQVGFAVVEQPVLGQVEDQQGPHSVVGEALPHLGEEEHVEALGMARELRLFLDGDLRADCEEDCENNYGNRGDPVAFLPQAHGFHTRKSCPAGAISPLNRPAP